MHREQINASRVVKQLRCLIKEMECLQTQVVDSDLPKLDKMLISTRENAIVTLAEYISKYGYLSIKQFFLIINLYLIW